MYNPKYFEEKSAELTIDLMKRFPFATVITMDANESFVNHLPIIAEKTADDEVILLGHMAKSNPQWKHFGNGKNVKFVFHGPHTYVTPTWYVSAENVPTWNYAVVHAEGIAEPIFDHDGIYQILKRTVNEFESAEARPWSLNLPVEALRGMVQAIVGFKVRVTKLEGKFKLNQNRSPEDRAGVMKGLEGRADEMSAGVLHLMTQKFSNQLP